jgi:nucleoside-diphosphate-sugar epimerase
VLIVAGGCRGRALAEALVGDGHAVRITTRSEQGRAAIETAGAECWIGTPDRLATLRGALENVTILCWMLATATGTPEELSALHGSRLEFFMTQAIDTTVRGVVYEAGGVGSASGAASAVASTSAAPASAMLAGGERIVRALAERNSIPTAFLNADPHDCDGWLADALAAVASLLSRA